MAQGITIIENSSIAQETPALSILIPFLRDDPTELLRALLCQIGEQSRVEILIYDDGTDNPHLTASICKEIRGAESSVKLMTAKTNKGRSIARNTLYLAARADWVLFLDADMRPVSSTFIHDYVYLINRNVADVIFGGFTVPETSEDASGELHRALSQLSDCLPSATRLASGPQFVASSNLCVRKAVLATEQFDDDFQGWGWEDSEWAARIAKRFKLMHADIPALHMGLESTETLLNRFQTSGPNYVRFAEKQPDFARTLTLHRLCQALRRTPGQHLMRPILKLIVRQDLLPMKLRIFSLKLWRASHYAQAFNDHDRATRNTRGR